MENILTKEVLGIQHIVECPALVPLLETWTTADNEDEKEEVNWKIEAFFTDEINMIFIPGMEEEKKKWNRCHPMKSKFDNLELLFAGSNFNITTLCIDGDSYDSNDDDDVLNGNSTNKTFFQ